VGRTAAQLLLRRIEAFDAPVETVLLPTELVIRDTTGVPPALHPRRKALV
jgi:LacI family transcriptional regulator